MSGDRSLRNSTDLSEARGHTTYLISHCSSASLRGLRPKHSGQGFPLNIRVSGTCHVPLAGRLTNPRQSR
jgi:hypothetical protein